MRMVAYDPFRLAQNGPAIIVGNRDLRRLRTVIERRATGPERTDAARLDAELRRAIVVPQAQLPADVVALGSRVAFEEVETGLRRTVQVVLPEEAHVSRGRLSILSPIGVALLGAASGEVVAYAAPSGRTTEIRIVSIERAGDGS
jgi:regulator of nucleoside diphosphate kinase